MTYINPVGPSPQAKGKNKNHKNKNDKEFFVLNISANNRVDLKCFDAMLGETVSTATRTVNVTVKHSQKRSVLAPQNIPSILGGAS